ncbi:glycosyltransferase family 2 protein [Rhizobium cremeum]|uniref:glycosyltransferase family 2 protein n=1 Tax=Rhizobium cremeum TaxID=2813827 RepID=UPI0013AFE5CE|nr:glycosyltransferase family 2 protein [Rhizobium cremeum]MCJ7996444.1 glycosyltransferase family 2 protein [Rhizobium cremeum]MCJ8001703.1 glycosyltransferase family 2 protein [Rhizobium cremeum]
MKVSVIIPCHNGEDFVAKAIHSVLNQTHTDVECIVIDDASRDRSREIILAISEKDQRVVPILLDRNAGPSAARNKAIDIATGEWITLLDADDLYKEDRLEVLLDLARKTDADAVVDNQSVRNFGDDRHVFDAFGFLKGSNPIPISQELFFRETVPVAFMNSGYLKPMFRRDYLIRNKLRYQEDCRVGEDFLLYSDFVTLNPKFYGTSYAGYIYFRRPNSLTRSGSSLQNLAAMSDELIARLGSRLTPASVKALETRKKVIIKHARWKDFRQALSAKDLKKATGLLLGDPTLVFMVKNFVRRRLQERGL